MAGNAAIGALHVTLGLNTANFEAGLKRAKGALGGFKPGKALKTGLGDLKSSLEDTTRGVAGVGNSLLALGPAGIAAGVALATVTTAMVAARSALSFGDDIADTAKKLAVTTDALQEYRFAVHALGGEYGDADAALEGFAKAFGAAHAGLSKKAAKPFEALGLDPKSFNSTEEALDAVVKKIAALKSSAEQAAIADKLGLTPMLTALRAGGDEIDRLRTQAKALGYVMDADVVAKAGDLNDQFEQSQQLLDIRLKSALVDLGPSLVDLINLATQLAGAFAAAAQAFKGIGEKSAQGLRDRQTQLLGEATRLGAKGIGGQRLSIPEQQRLARINAQLKEIEARLAEYAKADVPPPLAGGASLISPTGRTGGGKGRSLKDEAKRQAEEAARELEQQRDRVQAIFDDLLTPSEQAAQKARESVEALWASFQRGDIDAAKLHDTIARLDKALDVVAVKAPAIEDDIRDTHAEIEELGKSIEDPRQKMVEAFDEIGRSIEGAYYALKHNDWVGAAASIANAVKALKEAFEKGSTSAKKFAAVAAVAQAGGNIIGGTAGRAISGAASGAMAGAQFGVPGMIIGGLIGGVSSLLGSSKAKKQAREQARLAAYQAQMQLAADKRALELHLMELQGKAAEALALSRADELAAMDESLRAIQAQVWAEEDRAAAAEKAAEALEQVKAAQADAVSKAEDSLRSVFEATADQFQSAVDDWSGIAKDLKSYLAGFGTNSALGLGPTEQARATEADFNRLFGLAKSGDKDAFSQLTGAAESFLSAQRAISPDRASFNRVAADVKAKLAAAAAFAQDQVDYAQAQLDELKKLVGKSIDIDNSIKSGMSAVVAAIGGLAAAQAAATAAIAAAQAAATSANDNAAARTWTADGYLAKNPDVAAWAPGVIGQKGLDGKVITSIADAAAYHWTNYGAKEGRAFKDGGSFKVGGFGGLDSQLMQFRATPGEMVNVTHGDTMAALANGVRALASEMKLLRSETVAGALAAHGTFKILRRWEGDGQPPERVVA